MSNLAQGNYAGPDRRRYKVFVTHNSEYHCRDGVCVAVLSKRTGDFVSDHVALGLRISSGVRFHDNGAVASVSEPAAPQPGDQLCFSMLGSAESDASVITSRVRSVERPAWEVVLKHSEPETLH